MYGDLLYEIRSHIDIGERQLKKITFSLISGNI